MDKNNVNLIFQGKSYRYDDLLNFLIQEKTYLIENESVKIHLDDNEFHYLIKNEIIDFKEILEDINRVISESIINGFSNSINAKVSGFLKSKKIIVVIYLDFQTLFGLMINGNLEVEKVIVSKSEISDLLIKSKDFDSGKCDFEFNFFGKKIDLNLHYASFVLE